MPKFPGLASVNNPGVMTQAYAQKQRLFIDPISDYGAKFDHRVVFDGATTGGTGVITSATAAFVAGDIGKRIVLTAAGAGSGVNAAMYAGTIVSLNSGTSVNVTPNTTNTVSAKGLQIHTDDLTAWTNLITDINASVWTSAVIKLPGAMISTLSSGEAWQATPMTGRSGVSGVLPTINRPVSIIGVGGGFNTDAGDYSKAGGSCIAYCGVSWPSGFGAFMTFSAVIGSTNQALGASRLQSFWIDCRNGDGTQALKGVSFQSCRDWVVDDVFIMDPGAMAFELIVIDPGVNGNGGAALGDAKDCTRGMFSNIRIRCLESPAVGAVTTPFAYGGGTVTLSTVGQSLTVAANTLPTAGYVWITTNSGYHVLMQYTSGGGTTTLAGCVIEALASIDTPTISSGAFIVQAIAQNACSFLLNGDTFANACLNQFNTIIIEQGSVYGPPAVDFRNSDSNTFFNLVINGGSATFVSALNRTTRPGVKFNGSNTNLTLSARNNYIYGGTPGPGGCAAMGLQGTGTALLLSPATTNYWDWQQIANGEPLPIIETLAISATQAPVGAGFAFSLNGGFRIGAIGSVCAANGTIAAATTEFCPGTLAVVPSQGMQIGTMLRFYLYHSKTAAGVAARTYLIKYGSTGTSSDGTIASQAITPSSTATADSGLAIIDFVVTALGTGTSGTAAAQMVFTHNLAASATVGGLTNSLVVVQQFAMSMTGFNTSAPGSGNTYISLWITTGAAEIITVLPNSRIECLNPGNPSNPL